MILSQPKLTTIGTLPVAGDLERETEVPDTEDAGAHALDSCFNESSQHVANEYNTK